MLDLRLSGISRQPTYADLFSGIGGASLGFLNAGFQILGAVDNCSWTAEAHRYITGHNCTVADIGEMTTEELREAWGDAPPDVVLTSPPCTGYSRLSNAHWKNPQKAAHYKKLNALVDIGLSLVINSYKHDLPAIILLENVPGIEKRGSKHLLRVMDMLRREGYILDKRSHNLGSMAGIGQNRSRFLLIARHPQKCPCPVPLLPERKQPTLQQALGHLPRLGERPMHFAFALTEKTKKKLRSVPINGCNRDLEGKKFWKGTYGVLDPHGVSGTITAHARWDTGAYSWPDPYTGEHRPLSLLELAILQSFPEFIDGEPLNIEGNQKQIRGGIGRSIPPAATQVIGEACKLALGGFYGQVLSLNDGKIWVNPQ